MWTAAADGSSDALVTTGEWPRLSPDGRYLLFHRDNATYSRANIYVRDLVTGTETRIFTHGDYAVYYDWTNDGRVIFDYFCSIYTINRDGSGYGGWLSGPNCYDDAPAVNRNDGRVVFHNALYGMYVAQPNGTGKTFIPSTASGDYWPNWSPDGAWISFSRAGTVYKIRPDGTGLTKLAALAAGNLLTGPAPWTADGSWVVSAGTIGGRNGLHAISTSGDGTIVPLSTSAGASIDFAGSVPAPVASIDPAEIDFGIVAAGGESAPATVTVSNAATAPVPLRVGTLGVSSGAFAITDDACSRASVPAGGSCTADVVFAPSAGGASAGALSVPTNAPGGSLGVALTGEGDEGPPVATITTPSPSLLVEPLGHALEGTATDDVSGVASVAVTYTHLLPVVAPVTVDAALECATPTDCTWRAPLPDLGPYFITARATDVAGLTGEPSEGIYALVVSSR